MRYSKIATAVLLLFAAGLWVQGRRQLTAHHGGIGVVDTGGARLAQALALAKDERAGAAAAPRMNAQATLEVVSNASTPAVPEAALTGRKLIRTAELSIELERYDEGLRRAEEIAESLGGFVADAKSTAAAGERASGTCVLRVAPDRFAEALRRLSALGRVRARSMQTQDVTREYFDLETRLRVKRDAEARMRELLRNRTAKLSDVIEAEQQLERIVEEIETMEGERRLYDRQAALATVTLNLFEPGVAPPTVEPSFVEPIRQALRDARRALSSSVAGLIYAAAVVLPWAAAAALVWALARRVRARRTARAGAA
jgi:hypothetical protein